jgi:hypothetical protein
MPTPVPTNIICDPLNPQNIVNSKFGLQGHIFYTEQRLDSSLCVINGACTSRDYITDGTEINATLFMNDVFVPTRDFSQGFSTGPNTQITDSNGTLLTEWFALDLQSNFTLGPNDAEGDYQIATISDDGSTLTTGGKDILVNDGEHAPMLGCSTSTITLKQGDELPFRLTYFQGPRYQIALIMMWRKVTPGMDLTDCGTSDGNISDPSALPTALSSRGWTVMANYNYKIDGKNLCATP